MTPSGSGLPAWAGAMSAPASWTSQLNSTPVASSTRRVAVAISGPVPSPGISVTLCLKRGSLVRADVQRPGRGGRARGHCILPDPGAREPRSWRRCRRAGGAPPRVGAGRACPPRRSRGVRAARRRAPGRRVPGGLPRHRRRRGGRGCRPGGVRQGVPGARPLPRRRAVPALAPHDRDERGAQPPPRRRPAGDPRAACRGVRAGRDGALGRGRGALARRARRAAARARAAAARPIARSCPTATCSASTRPRPPRRSAAPAAPSSHGSRARSSGCARSSIPRTGGARA